MAKPKSKLRSRLTALISTYIIVLDQIQYKCTEELIEHVIERLGDHHRQVVNVTENSLQKIES